MGTVRAPSRGRSGFALAFALVGACGGRIEDGATPSRPEAAAPAASSPASAPRPPREPGNEVPNLGFDVQGGWALPDLRGFVLSSFAGACTGAGAREGDHLLVVRFNEAVGEPEIDRLYVVASGLDAEVPSGASDFVDVTAPACAERVPGANKFMSGSVILRRITEDGIEGELRGMVVHPGQLSGGDMVVGRFRLPRCAGPCFVR